MVKASNFFIEVINFTLSRRTNGSDSSYPKSILRPGMSGLESSHAFPPLQKSTVLSPAVTPYSHMMCSSLGIPSSSTLLWGAKELGLRLEPGKENSFVTYGLILSIDA